MALIFILQALDNDGMIIDEEWLCSLLSLFIYSMASPMTLDGYFIHAIIIFFELRLFPTSCLYMFFQ